MIYETTTLYYREGTSDKVYQASVEEADETGGCLVTFAFGRRGSTMQTGTKTPTPVPLVKALSIYHKLVDEKMAKGYSPGTAGTRYVSTPREARATDVYCQLLNTVDDDALESLFINPLVWAQEKHDGKRMLLRVTPNQVVGINRNGLTCGLPEPIEHAVRVLQRIGPAMFTLDGECVGDTYHAFDCLGHEHDIHHESYAYRLTWVERIVSQFQEAIRTVYTAIDEEQKRTLFAVIRDTGREGIVFKESTAPYTPGRPASGGPQLKYKFTQTATVVVTEISPSRRSVSVAVVDDSPASAHGRSPLLTGVGAVTIPPNYVIPERGALVEVRYLYAYPGGSLYQPVYLGTREDMDLDTCTLSQLKVKQGPEDPRERPHDC